MGARMVMRWIALGAPYPWFGFATHFKATRDVVGSDFFQEFAKSIHARFQGKGTDAGLIDDFGSLASDRFDPSRVAPIIREFYEHTTRFNMDINIQWNPIVRPFGALYDWFIAKRMRQLDIPLDRSTLAALDSWLELITLSASQKPDFRCWIRVDKDTRSPIYVGAYRTYRSALDGYAASYISVAFPVPGGNMTTVLTPRNLDSDGLELTTRTRESTEVGVYLIVPHQLSFTMMPAFGLSERFQLRPAETADGLDVEVFHDCYWLGVRAFQMHYRIARKAEAEVARLAATVGAATSRIVQAATHPK